MQVVSIVLLSVLGVLVAWLVIDTVIMVVKKTKAKRQKQDETTQDD